MADIEVIAAYASVVEDDEDGMLFVGFAQGEDEDEGYVLFRQVLTGGPVWFEANDEAFGAEDALAEVRRDGDQLHILIAAEKRAAFGWAASVQVTIGPDCEDLDEALVALQDMLGGVWVGA